MKAIGQPFDPNIHEAVAHQPSSDLAEGLVAAEYQAGYTIGDVVIRHAMVSVSDGPGPSGEVGEATQEADQTSEGVTQDPGPADEASSTQTNSTQTNWDSPES